MCQISLDTPSLSAGEQRIISPTVCCANYLSALRSISNRTRAEPLIRMLDFAQRFSRARSLGATSTARRVSLKRQMRSWTATRRKNRAFGFVFQKGHGDDSDMVALIGGRIVECDPPKTRGLKSTPKDRRLALFVHKGQKLRERIDLVVMNAMRKLL